MDTTFDRVIFRTFKDGDVIALFPDIPYSDFDNTIMSYQHIGQHGAANYNHILKISRLSTPAEYKNIMTELVSIGYFPIAVDKINHKLGKKIKWNTTNIGV